MQEAAEEVAAEGEEQEAAEEVAAEGEEQVRRGSIAHTTDEGEEYYELTDEKGAPTGQTTWTDPSVPGARNCLFRLLHWRY